MTSFAALRPEARSHQISADRESGEVEVHGGGGSQGYGAGSFAKAQMG